MVDKSERWTGGLPMDGLPGRCYLLTDGEATGRIAVVTSAGAECIGEVSIELMRILVDLNDADQEDIAGDADAKEIQERIRHVREWLKKPRMYYAVFEVDPVETVELEVVTVKKLLTVCAHKAQADALSAAAFRECKAVVVEEVPYDDHDPASVLTELLRDF